MVHHRAGWLNPVFEGFSYLGSLGIVWLAIAVVLAALWRRPFIFAWVLAAVVVAEESSYGLREWIGRPRPFVHYALPKPLVREPSDPSLPSGHAAVAFAGAAVLTSFAPRLAVPLFLLAAAIAFSRVYVGVHYPLDVLAGAGYGLLVGGVFIALRRLVEARRRSRRSPQ